MNTSAIEEHDIEGFSVRSERHDDFCTLIIRGDFGFTDVIAIGDSLYNWHTPLSRTPPVSQHFYTLWGIQRFTLATERSARFETALFDGPSLTYEIVPDGWERRDEIIILTDQPHLGINAFESTLNIELPKPVTENITT